MTKKASLLLALFSFCTNLFAQKERMDTDRPDQTESPVTVKERWLQAEFGVNIERKNNLLTFVHPSTLWKYGLTRRFEFRLITEFISAQTPIIIPFGNEVVTGLLPVQIGGKVSLWQEKGFLPKTSLIFHIAPSKLGSKKFQTGKWAPNFVFTMQHTLSENIGLGYNLGAEWDGESNTPYLAYTIAPGFNIGKSWYGYIEMFGAIRKNEIPQHHTDGGLAYYFNNNMRIDFSSGFGISEPAPGWYGAIGFSFRFKTKKENK